MSTPLWKVLLMLSVSCILRGPKSVQHVLNLRLECQGALCTSRCHYDSLIRANHHREQCAINAIECPQTTAFSNFVYSSQVTQLQPPITSTELVVNLRHTSLIPHLATLKTVTSLNVSLSPCMRRTSRTPLSSLTSFICNGDLNRVLLC